MKRLAFIVLSLLLVLVLISSCSFNAQKPAIEENETASENGLSASETESSQAGSSQNEENKTIDDNVSPANSDSENPEADFVIFEPKEGQLVESGRELVIKGKTRIKNFRIEVEDGHNILGEASVETKDKSDGFVEFETEISLDSHTSPSGMIIFVYEGQDGKRQENFILPVKYE
mgnify:FL=1